MPFLSLILGFVVAIVGSPGDSPAPGPDQQDPIRVVSSSHEIDFPNSLVLKLEAEGDAEITDVQLFYRLGPRDVSIYGYAEFTPAKQVSTDFKIKTSGSSYLPSGVDVEYRFVIRDADGNTFESETFSLEYKDPRFQWQTLSRGDMVILWHDRPVSKVEQVATLVSRRLESVKGLLGLETVKPMKAVIVNSAREAGRSFPFISETASRGHLFAGFAFGELDVTVLVGLNPDIIVHEMTHLLFDEAVDSPLARVPAWLNEGLAMYFESGSSGREATVLRAARRDSLIPLRSMARVPGRPRDVMVFYAQAWSFVKHMMDAHGQERMADLLAAINDGESIEKAVHETYGISLQELDQEWRSRLTGESPPSRAPSPASSATSAIIAGALGVAVVAIVVGWLKSMLRANSTENTAP